MYLNPLLGGVFLHPYSRRDGRGGENHLPYPKSREIEQTSWWDVIEFAEVNIFSRPFSIFILENVGLAKIYLEFELQIGLDWLSPDYLANEWY